MPFYQYECEKCKKAIEVLRSMSEHDRPPEEADFSKKDEPVECEHKWMRVIGSVTKQYGASWGWDRKGHYNNS